MPPTDRKQLSILFSIFGTATAVDATNLLTTAILAVCTGMIASILWPLNPKQ